MAGAVAGDSSPPGPGANRSGLALFSYATGCGELWGHTGSFPGYRAFGAAAPGGRGAVAVLVNASDLPDAADAALRDAQEIAACRAIGEPLP